MADEPLDETAALLILRASVRNLPTNLFRTGIDMEQLRQYDSSLYTVALRNVSYNEEATGGVPTDRVPRTKDNPLQPYLDRLQRRSR